MKKFCLYVVLTLVMAATLAAFPIQNLLAFDPLPAPVQRVYDRTDKAVIEGKPGAAWAWGPRVQDSTEPYKESPNGQRQVYYFEKGRLEITDPAKNPADKYYVTSGLLLREMITGQIQTGDNQTEAHGPANVPLAGDLAPGVPDSPTYASLTNLVSFDGSWKSNDLTGQPVNLTLGLGGAVSTRPDLAQGTVYGQYYKETGHNVAKPFVDFMNKKGLVYQNKSYQNNQPVFDPIYFFGYPIAEPYWAHVTVAGKEKYVLVQAFERRLLTYTPDNPDPYKVELGNLGLAYVQWRYKTPVAPLNNADPGYDRPAANDAFNLYNAVNSNMQKLSAVKRTISVEGKVLSRRQYQAPDRAFLQDSGFDRNGQPVTLETIYVGKRTFARLVYPGGRSSDWIYADSSTAFSWPVNYSTFRNLSLNDWSLNWQLGQPIAAKNDNLQPLIVSYNDIDGTKNNLTRLISSKSQVMVGMTTDSTDTDNNHVVLNEAYSDFNVANNIQPPAVAYPANGVNVTPVQLAKPLQSENPQAFDQLTQPQRLMVRFKPSVMLNQAMMALPNDYIGLVPDTISKVLPDGTLVYEYTGGDFQGTLSQLQSDPRVDLVSPDYVRHSTISQFSDPQAGDEYYLKAIRAPRAWDATTGSKGVTVAIIDTGADVNNPDLKGNIAETYDANTADSTDVSDLAGHGSWTTGIIGAIGNNNVYGSGVAWNSRLLVIKANVPRQPDSFDDATVIRALNYAVDRGAKVINLSLGGSNDNAFMREAIANAVSKGVIVVVASGNEGTDAPEYPASYPGVISVGATGWYGEPTYFSSYGSHVILSAPGLHICNTVRAGQFTCANGTSASAPIVSGAAALVLGINPQLTADQVKAILIASAVPAPGKQPGQRDDKYGYGTLDVATAVRMAATNQIPALPGDLPK